MAASGRKGSNCASIGGLNPSDRIIVVGTSNDVVNTYIINATSFFANSNVPHATVGNNAMSTANLVLREGTAPANSTANGTAGEIRRVGNTVYLCIDTNSWMRFVLEDF